MNSKITTLDRVPAAANVRTILSKAGFNCSLIMLAAGDETPPRSADQGEEHLLFVVEGDVTVRFEETNTILSKDQALLIPKGKEHVIAAHPGSRARILHVEVPPRQVITPPIFSFEG